MHRVLMDPPPDPKENFNWQCRDPLENISLNRTWGQKSPLRLWYHQSVLADLNKVNIRFSLGTSPNDTSLIKIAASLTGMSNFIYG